MAPIWRLKRSLDETGSTKSQWYADVSDGLMTRGVKLSARAVGWPSEEVVAIRAARVAGETKEGIRRLVQRLHAARLLGAPPDSGSPAPTDHETAEGILGLVQRLHAARLLGAPPGSESSTSTDREMAEGLLRLVQRLQAERLLGAPPGPESSAPTDRQRRQPRSAAVGAKR